MTSVKKLFLTIILSTAAFSCASYNYPPKSMTINHLLDKRFSALPVQVMDNGLLTVPVRINDAKPVRFMIDTGATRSAIYKSSALELGLPIESEKTVQIHGMIQNERRPEIRASKFVLGNYSVINTPLAILDRPKDEALEIETDLSGILAMDILINYQLIFDHKSKTLHFTKNRKKPLKIPQHWKQIKLTTNPYIDDGRNLRFLEMRMIGSNTSALLDTGSELNIMNWHVAKYPNVRQLRKRLRETWKLTGAIGQFKPRVRAQIKGFRAGQKYWRNQEFIVMDFDSLDILGIKDKPFIIAGVGLINETSFILDFRHNILALSPLEDTHSRPCD